MTALIVPPITPQCAALANVWPGRNVQTLPSGDVTWVTDTAEFEFYVDAPVGCPPSLLAPVMQHLYAIGLEPMSESECPPEVQPDGRLRVWLVPVDPVSDAAIPVISLVGGRPE